ncbi:MAG: SCO family protein [Gemmatimonadota bacterium]
MDRDDAQALTGLVALFAITATWWALALWPVADGPAWLERTRYVCFGVRDNGLPDRSGWIGLVAAPLGMLSILLVGWHDGMKSLLRRARGSRALAATLSGLTLGCALMITAAAVRVHDARPPAGWADGAGTLPPATYPRLDSEAPALSLISQHGDVVDLGDLAGQPVLVTFAYAHCTTVCPVVVLDALRAQELLRGSAVEPAVLIVTLDPWRDTPSRLPAMARSWGLPPDGAWVLGGSPAVVDGVLDAWNVARSRDATTGEITHPSLIYVVAADGLLAYASTGGPDALVSLLRRLRP